MISGIDPVMLILGCGIFSVILGIATISLVLLGDKLRDEPDWLEEHRANREYLQPSDDATEAWDQAPIYSRNYLEAHPPKPAFLKDHAFNRHATNDGSHNSPYDEGRILVGLDGLDVRLIQGVNEESLKNVLSRTLRATTGLAYDAHPNPRQDGWEEMMRGGLQSALESQVVVFQVIGASRALTHQLVRSRKAAFHQQSQRATWYGDKPNVRWPESIVNPDGGRSEAALEVLLKWETAQIAAWEAYKAACDAGVSYQDARFILPEGTTNFIICEYSLREFLNVYAYRACSMFMWEMVGVMRRMGKLLVEAHPFLEPYVKISCEKGALCFRCKGSGKVWQDGIASDLSEVAIYEAESRNPDGVWRIVTCWQCSGQGSTERKCTFQGWESVEGQCDFPWAKQSNRVFLPDPKFRIGK